MAEKSREKTLIYIIRGVFLALATLGIKSAVYFFTVVLCNEATSPFAHFPTWYINLLTFIATLFIYNSVVRFVVTYNRSIYTEFILEKREPVSKKDEALRVLSSRKEFFEMLSSFLSVFILTAAGAFFEPVAAIPVSMPIPVSRILNCGVILFCIIPIDIFARVDVRRFWYESVRMHEEDRLFKPARAILRAFVILIIYPFVFPFTPLLLFAFGTLFGAFIACGGFEIIVFQNDTVKNLLATIAPGVDANTIITLLSGVLVIVVVMFFPGGLAQLLLEAKGKIKVLAKKDITKTQNNL